MADVLIRQETNDSQRNKNVPTSESVLLRYWLDFLYTKIWLATF